MKTPEEFKAELERLADEADWDPELAHRAMDDAMCELLKELGYGEAVKVFEDQEKWYGEGWLTRGQDNGNP